MAQIVGASESLEALKVGLIGALIVGILFYLFYFAIEGLFYAVFFFVFILIIGAVIFSIVIFCDSAICLQNKLLSLIPIVFFIILEFFVFRFRDSRCPNCGRTGKLVELVHYPLELHYGQGGVREWDNLFSVEKTFKCYSCGTAWVKKRKRTQGFLNF